MVGSSNNMVLIPGTEVCTSSVGFGSSGLMGSAITDSGRLALLNFAYDLSIAHYDTAPLYGLGDAEKVLGKFLKRKRSSVTVATKYGLSPPHIPWFYRQVAP